MALGSFDNPIAGAGGDLTVNQVRSPNFNLAAKTGWEIQKNGNAFFFNIVATGTITATEFDGTTFQIVAAGYFLYSAAPGAGDLVLSIASAAGTDRFGNPYPGGLTVGLNTMPQMQLASSGGIGSLQVLYNNAGFGTAIIEGAILTGFASFVINGAKNLTAGHTDFVGLEFNSSDGTSSANMTLIYNDASGVAHTTMTNDWTGFNVPAGTINAVAPGTGTSPVNAASPESWHAPSLPGGWGGGMAYKLYPDKTVGLAGLVTLPAAGAYNGVVLFTLPAAYRPGGIKRLPIAALPQSSAYGNNAASIGLPRVFIDTTGNVSLAGLPVSVNSGQVCVDGCRFPIDI
jgi:hypothetical protein